MADPYAALGTVATEAPAAPKQEADPYAALGKPAEQEKPAQAPAKKQKDEGYIGKAMNWAKSEGAKDDVQEYLRGGFLGRATNAVMGRAAAAMMGKPYDPDISQGTNKAKNIGGPQVEEHDPAFKEQMEQVWQVATTHPQQFAVEFAKSIGQDPELLFPGFWEYTPAKMAAVAAKIAEMGKAASVVTKVGGAAVRGAGVMTGAETLDEIAEGKLNSENIKAAAVQGAGFGVTSKALGSATKAVKKFLSPTGKVPSGKSFQDMMKEFQEEPKPAKEEPKKKADL